MSSFAVLCLWISKSQSMRYWEPNHTTIRKSHIGSKPPYGTKILQSIRSFAIDHLNHFDDPLILLKKHGAIGSKRKEWSSQTVDTSKTRLYTILYTLFLVMAFVNKWTALSCSFAFVTLNDIASATNVFAFRFKCCVKSFLFSSNKILSNPKFKIWFLAANSNANPARCNIFHPSIKKMSIRRNDMFNGNM